VTDRTNVREFNRRDGGSGKVFKVDLVDKDGGDIQVNFWNDHVNKFNHLKKGDVITLKGASVKVANKKYNSTSSNYELHVDSSSVEIKAAEGADGFDNVSDFAHVVFTAISDIKDKELPLYPDLLVMVASQQPTKEIKKADKTLNLRPLVVVDQSLHSVDVALWDPVYTEESLVGRCLAIRKAGVTDYNNRSCNANLERIEVDPPNLPAAAALKEWWESAGKDANVHSLSDNSGGASSQQGKPAEKMEGTISEMNEVMNNMTSIDRVIDFSTVAYLSGSRTQTRDGAVINYTYNSCPTCRCKVQDGDFCAKCQRVVQTQPRYILSNLTFEDNTQGKRWASALEEGVCTGFLGKTAAEAKAMQGDLDGLSTVVNKAIYTTPYLLKFRLNMDEYQGDLKAKARVSDAAPLKRDMYAAAGQQHLKKLAELYHGLPAETQASVKALLTDLPTMCGAKAVQEAWQADLTSLRAVVA